MTSLNKELSGQREELQKDEEEERRKERGKEE